MKFSCNLFVLLLLPLLALQISTCDAYVNPIYHACNKNFTSDNLLKGSINQTLTSLLAKTPLDTFGISSFGKGFFTIYGLGQCRGDLTVDQCSLCMTKATKEIQTLCPNSAEARIWYDHCFLHYDTSKFFGKPDTSFTHVFSSGRIAVDPIQFNQDIINIFKWMMSLTSGLHDIFSNTYDRKKLIVYTMTQCTRDLEVLACKECLDTLFENFAIYCKYHLDCYVISSSCVMRYGDFDFLQNSVSLSPLVFAAGSD